MSIFVHGKMLLAVSLGLIFLPTIAGCVLKCGTDSRCGVTVSKIPGKECRKISKQSHPAEQMVTDFTISWSKNTSNVTWSRGMQTGSSLLLMLPKQGGGRLCFNISSEDTKITDPDREKMLLQCKRVGASVAGKKSGLYDPVRHEELATRLVKRPKRKHHRHDKRCECRYPWKVNAAVNGSIIRVEWQWENPAHTDLLKVVITKENNTEYIVLSTTINTTQFDPGKYEFTNFNLRGRYIALVGSAVCPTCKTFRHSAPFQYPQGTTDPPKTRSSRHLCVCVTPSKVYMKPYNNTNIIVKWEPYISNKDLSVGIVNQNNPETFVVSKNIPNYMLLQPDAVEQDFKFNKPPGIYIALVGSSGCSRCMRYRESEPLRWPIESSTHAGITPNITDLVLPPSNEDEITLKIGFLIALSVLSCIAMLACGIAIYRQKPCSVYAKVSTQASNTNGFMMSKPGRLGDVSNVMVLRVSDDDDLQHVSGRVVAELQRRGIAVESKLLSAFEPSEECDVILYVSMTDDVNVPESLKTVTARTALVAISNNAHESPVVHFPPDFIFAEVQAYLPNNRPSLDLIEFLNLLGNPGEQDIGHKIFVVASEDDHAHLEACEELAVILRKLEVEVIFAKDPENLRDQRANISEWSKNQVDAARFIVVVASNYMTTTNDFNGSVSSISNLTNLSCKAMDRITEMDSDQRRQKVVLVSLGYMKDSLTRIQQTYLNECQVFTLLHHGQDGEPVLNLRPFLNHLCTDSVLVELVCGQGQVEFLDRVTARLEGMGETCL